eukprot:TRINITY_DN7974_c0_g2_i1.p3 TRINITY_DN7974_c0_g2~~TRINITY_DN7974_c0_g2_i1.p3  ORF type:complete len:112 (-),score=27.31 TRINITY_DN7974_c0_g2_i1:81-416(-)
MGSAAAGEPAEEGEAGEVVVPEGSPEGGGVEAAEGVVEAHGGAGAEVGGDGGDDGGRVGASRRGIGGIVVGEVGWGEVGDVAEEEAVDVAGGRGETLDYGGECGAVDGDLL